METVLNKSNVAATLNKVKQYAIIAVAIVIGFLTQDEPDSESDEVINEERQLSMEEKIAQMETESIAWLNYFLDNYTYSISGTFTLQPVYRIKGVMTGVLLTLTVIEPNQC